LSVQLQEKSKIEKKKLVVKETSSIAYQTLANTSNKVAFPRELVWIFFRSFGCTRTKAAKIF
jgi:hypothetical protein